MFECHYITAGPFKESAGEFSTRHGFGGESREDSCDRHLNDGAFPSGATILVVEDEKMVRDVVVEMLHVSGLAVLEAEHGCGALTIYEQSHCSIDLILTDVVMPHMGGRELADRVRTVVPDIAVFYMSGH